MKNFNWDPDKNRELIETREMSFDRIVYHIDRGDVLDVIEHPSPGRYANQRIFIIHIDAYCWVVPFVESDLEYFLKTAYPSRHMTKRYLEGGE